VVRDSQRRFLQAVEETRIDQQVGPGGGATSVVSKTGMVPLFGFGLDSNDAIRTIDPNVLSLRVNLDGMTRFLSNQETILVCSVDPSCPEPGRFKNVEMWVAFNVSGASASGLEGYNPSSDPLTEPQNIGFSAPTRGGFANATVRLALDNRLGLRRVEYTERWIQWIQGSDDLLRTGGRDFSSYLKLKMQQLQQIGADGKLVRDTGATDQYTLWLRESREKLKNAPPNEEEWRKILAAQLDALLDKIADMDRDYEQRSEELAKSYVRYLEARRDLELTTIIPETGSVLEYSYSEAPLQPRYHTVNFAHSYNVGSKANINPGIFTFNVGMNFYHDAEPAEPYGSTSRWRGGHLSLQFDRPMGPANSIAQLSVGAHYQYLANPVVIVPPGAAFSTGSPSVAAATRLVAQQGSMFSSHATVIIRTARSGLKIPIGVSWASRTDLKKGQEVRGHIGFTFDSTPLALLPGVR
jgi:hypothetical protein